MSITAALISGAISAGINWWNTSNQKKANRISAAENANDSIRKYNESVRQQQVQNNQYSNSVNRTYGSDFLSKLQKGSSVSELIDSIGDNTALGKQLKEYETEAEQTIQNSNSTNQQAGMLASMQGNGNALSLQELKRQAQQAEGAAIASQSISGIRANAGTGNNAQTIQQQANQSAEDQLVQQIQTQNSQSLVGMEQTQASALQSADSLRRQSDITSQQAIEQALNNYDSHIAQMQDYDTEQNSYKSDAEYYASQSKGGWTWDLTNFGDESGRINEDYSEDNLDFLKFEDDRD